MLRSTVAESKDQKAKVRRHRRSSGSTRPFSPSRGPVVSIDPSGQASSTHGPVCAADSRPHWWGCGSQRSSKRSRSGSSSLGSKHVRRRSSGRMMALAHSLSVRARLGLCQRARTRVSAVVCGNRCRPRTACAQLAHSCPQRKLHCRDRSQPQILPGQKGSSTKNKSKKKRAAGAAGGNAAVQPAPAPTLKKKKKKKSKPKAEQATPAAAKDGEGEEASRNVPPCPTRPPPAPPKVLTA